MGFLWLLLFKILFSCFALSRGVYDRIIILLDQRKATCCDIVFLVTIATSNIIIIEYYVNERTRQMKYGYMPGTHKATSDCYVEFIRQKIQRVWNSNSIRHEYAKFNIVKLLSP